MLGPNPYAEEALLRSSVARNQPGMASKVPVGNQPMLSSGPMDKLGNPQAFNNSVHNQQSMQQNMMSAVPQAQANAVRGMRKDQVTQSQEEYKAQQLLATRKAEVLAANDGGAAVMQLNALMSDPASQSQFMQRIGESQLMAAGNNPHNPAGNNPHNPFQSTNFRA